MSNDRNRQTPPLIDLSEIARAGSCKASSLDRMEEWPEGPAPSKRPGREGRTVRLTPTAGG